jgi:quercetin dioxygenase-like cupin family protein
MGADKVHVLSLDETPIEELPGGGMVQRIITKQGTGMDITFSKALLKPGCGHLMHNHDQDEAVSCLEGEGTMAIEGQGEVKYSAGMALVIPKGVKHQNKNTSSKDTFVVSMFNPALR